MNLVDYAYDMVMRGYKVFPLIPGGKKPAHTGWLLEATDDLARVEQLWAENPNFNIGVLTNGFVVADLDTKKGDLVIPAFVQRGGNLQHTFTVRTASGGYHCYYNAGPNAGYEQSYHQAISKLATGIDIKSYHNYVVGPGSVTEVGTYSVVNDVPRTVIPHGIECDLRPAGQPVDRKDSANVDQPHNVALAVQFINSAAPAVEGQGGDNATFALAARITRDYAISPHTAFDLMQEWNQRCIPPWEADDLYNKIVNASSYGQNDLGKRTPDAAFSGVPLASIPPPPTAPPLSAVAQLQQQQSDEADAFIDPYNYDDLSFGNNIPLTELTRREWKVENMAIAGQVTLLGGYGSAGKSTLELTFAAHFSLGKSIGPYKPVMHKPQRIFIYNAEDDRKEQTLRMFGCCIQHEFDFKQVMQNIIFADAKQKELAFMIETNKRIVISRKNVEGFINFITKNSIDVIMLDPLANLHGASEQDNAQMQRFMTIMRTVTQRTGCAAILAHHVSKASGKVKDSMNALRGAGSLVNSARNVFLASTADKEDTNVYDIPKEDFKNWVRLSVVKSNVGKKRTTFFKFNEVGVPVDNASYNENVAVLQYHQVKKRKDVEEDEVLEQVRKTDGKALYDKVAELMVMEGTGAITMVEVIRALRERVPEAERKSTTTYQRIFKDKFPEAGVKTELGLLKVDKGSRQYIVTLE